MSAQSYPTRADANRANSQSSTGPRTEAGKAAASTNAPQHRAAAVEPRRSSVARSEKMDPRDSPAYQQHLADLTTGLAPANPAEHFLIRDLAMLKARLDRLEAAEYAALISAMDGNIDEASAYLATAPNLASLEKTERFLRRNYMQTWSRLERLQRQRKNEERERKQAATDEHQQTPEATQGMSGTKQSQCGSTHSNQELTTNPTAAPPAQPTANLGSPVVPAPSPANCPINKTKANAA